MQRRYANSLEGRPPESWQPLEAHLEGVADREGRLGMTTSLCEMCSSLMPGIIAHLVVGEDGFRNEEPLASHLLLTACFAGRFGATFHAGSLARALAIYHDLGKCSREFQAYIRRSVGDTEESGEKHCSQRGPDHSTAGAQELSERLPGIGLLLAYAAAGHHGGLPDGRCASDSCLVARLGKALPEWKLYARDILDRINCDVVSDVIAQELRPFLTDGYSTGFLVRMLFSCLVDADFLATECFMDDARSVNRGLGASIALSDLQERLNRFYEELARKARAKGTDKTPVNLIRNEVRADCLIAATASLGLFSLTVPTGGGKTLSSIAFALKHAVLHGLSRIIYVIPFTSIIEQNAQIFREVFGEDAVLEHHCAAEVDDDSRAKLLAENWDAPIIVTTSVQFFESLHANKASKSRKLHNVANAVVILDEAQALPVDLLAPCLRALDELVLRYRTSVVLCTATQPAVLSAQMAKGGLTGGVGGCREIVGPSRNLHARLKRVVAERIPEKLTDDELVTRLAVSEAFLTVVGTRRHARELYLRMKRRFQGEPESVFHLSAQMCPEHRYDKLMAVKRRLAEKLPCRVVSTQLIEAGVDIDFPCVFREIAGLDSCAQAAGRCNREGVMLTPGRVCLFESAEFAPRAGFLRTAAQIGRMVIDLPPVPRDLLAPEAVTKYFELLYADQRQSLDKYGVLSECMPAGRPRDRDSFFLFLFRTLGERFKFIEDHAVTVYVPYGEKGLRLCEALRQTCVPGDRRRLARKLQRYAVSVYGQEPRDGIGNLIAEKVHDAYWILTSAQTHYSGDLGIAVEGLDDQMLNV